MVYTGIEDVDALLNQLDYHYVQRVFMDADKKQFVDILFVVNLFNCVPASLMSEIVNNFQQRVGDVHE